MSNFYCHPGKAGGSPFGNSAGQQKGVDSLLVTDLIDLARNQAISDAVIVTGDGDMRIAVQIAQSFGVRVHLVGLEPSRASQSQLLRQEADTVHQILCADVAKFMTHTSPASSTPQSSLELQVDSENDLPFMDAVERSLRTVLSVLGSEDLSALRQVTTASKRIPEQYDRRILGTCRTLLKRDLNVEERRTMRKEAVKFLNSTETSAP